MPVLLCFQGDWKPFQRTDTDVSDLLLKTGVIFRNLKTLIEFNDVLDFKSETHVFIHNSVSVPELLLHFTHA